MSGYFVGLLALLFAAAAMMDDTPEDYRPYLFVLSGVALICATLIHIFGKEDE